MKNGEWEALKTENIIRKKTFEFALEMIRLGRDLQQEREFILSKQLIRSGTSIGANVEEADVAQSKRDFIAKMSIALKETRETQYWLRLLEGSKIGAMNYQPHIQNVQGIERILTAILKTSRNRQNQ